MYLFRLFFFLSEPKGFFQPLPPPGDDPRRPLSGRGRKEKKKEESKRESKPTTTTTTMICIECMSPVQTLYTSYSLSNIRLTACPQCNKFADKYIEYDNVLIFIDLLLLRPRSTGTWSTIRLPRPKTPAVKIATLTHHHHQR